VFTISTREYREARDAGRAPAGWNELIALRATLETHAQEHMARLERADRERDERAALEQRGAVTQPEPRRSPLARLFGRRKPAR
jgi:hypothetical protein